MMRTGLGIQLALCAALVAACGGKIDELADASVTGIPDGGGPDESCVVVGGICEGNVYVAARTGSGYLVCDDDAWTYTTELPGGYAQVSAANACEDAGFGDAGGDDVEPDGGGILPTGVEFPCGYTTGEACEGDAYLEASVGTGYLVCFDGAWDYSAEAPAGYVPLEISCADGGEDDGGFFDGGDDSGFFDGGEDDSGFADGGGDDGGFFDGGGDDGGFSDGGGGDDAGGVCVPPQGGPPCTPEAISCGSNTCSTTGDQCCEVSGSPSVCQPADTALCPGNIVQCEETADCPKEDDICCLDVTAASPASSITSCQTGPTCPATSQLAYAQICRSDTECASGTCVIYSCLGGTITIEACKGTLNGALAGTCTPMP